MKKTKNDKKNPPPINSIDIKHNEMLEGFNKIENETIPKLQQDKRKWKELMNQYHNHPPMIDQYLDARDKYEMVKREIKDLSKKRNRYLLENSPFIFHYFEEKKKISTIEEGDKGGGGKGEENRISQKVHQFFKMKAPTATTDISGVVQTTTSMPENDRFKQSKTAYQNYWRNVNNEITNIQQFIVPADICSSCYKGELIAQEEEGILICNNGECGIFTTYIIDSSKPTNKEPPNEVSYTAYNRLNHFKEILSQFQAKETTQIPDEVLETIRNRIKKERITDLSKINYMKMKEILRKLGLNRYFEHIQYINSLFGIKPPIMNEELHETLCVLFIEIQKPWAVHCPPDRTNFFNYTYTLHQLCVLLDQTQYLPYIPLMKDREKQLEQDMIWKKVCNDLDWVFIPSV